MTLCDHLLALVDAQGRAALVTIVQAEGSTPRGAGTQMIVAPSGAIAGTIGGGALEWAAMEAARRLLAGGVGHSVLDVPLGPALGQCCGGRVKLSLQVVDAATVADAGLVQAPARTVVGLFGAGHVGRALVLALAPLPFAVRWFDPRPDAFPAHLPQHVEMSAMADAGQAVAGLPDGALVAVMTHSHPLDLSIVAAALRARRFRYVGLIGSATKRARFLGQLQQAGLDDVAGALVCPIGAGLSDKTPAVIAAGIAFELCRVRENQAR